MTKIAAFDLGSTTGMALGESHFLGHLTSVKTWSVETAPKKLVSEAQKTGQARFLDPRIAAFSKLVERNKELGVNLIVFEDIQFGRSVAQCQIWGSFRGVLQSFAARNDVSIVSVPTGTLKKWTTKNGGAQKEDMRKAAEKRWPTFVKPETTHDEIDALALLMWGFEYWYRKQLSLGE